MEELNVRFVFAYDEDADIWIGEGREQYEGIILEADSINILAKKIEEVIKERNNR